MGPSLSVTVLSAPVSALWVVTVDWFSSWYDKFQEETQLSLDWGVGSHKEMTPPAVATWVRKGPVLIGVGTRAGSH